MSVLLGGIKFYLRLNFGSSFGVFHKVFTMSTHNYKTEEYGSLYGLDYRMYFKNEDGKLISPWHDIPLYANKEKSIYNMIVEIPRWTNAKMELATKEPMSPIKQDVKNGLPRFVDNVFPYSGYIWNYGALPQTWEYPKHIEPTTGAVGDNDPIDIFDISSKIHKRGAVVPVKVVGVIALIDEGETDWKLVAIDITDEKANEVNSIEDVEKNFPGLLEATHNWFQRYKIPAGKPPNRFGFDGKFQSAEFAHKVIEQTHDFWKKLIKEGAPPLNTETLSESHGKHPANLNAWEKIVAAQPPVGKMHEIPKSLDKWHFIKL